MQKPQKQRTQKVYIIFMTEKWGEKNHHESGKSSFFSHCLFFVMVAVAAFIHTYKYNVCKPTNKKIFKN